MFTAQNIKDKIARLQAKGELVKYSPNHHKQTYVIGEISISSFNNSFDGEVMGYSLSDLITSDDIDELFHYISDIYNNQNNDYSLLLNYLNS